MRSPGTEQHRGTRPSPAAKPAARSNGRPVPAGRRSTASESAGFSVGNVMINGRRGWFVGQFFAEETGLRHQQALEIKWGQHPKGEQRAGFARSATATTVSLLVRGAFTLKLRVDGRLQEITLRNPGDYAIYGPGIPHSWEALEDCLVISVRFPSIDGDQAELSQHSDAPK